MPGGQSASGPIDNRGTASGRQPVDGRLVVSLGPSISPALLAGLETWSPTEVMPGAGLIDLLAPASSADRLLHIATSVISRELQRLSAESEVRLRKNADSRGDGSSRWLDVSTPEGADRFASVRVPSWWAEARRLCLVSRLPGRATGDRDRPLATLARLAHPRQQWAARFSRQGAALSAELASPWHPRLVVSVGTLAGRRVAVLSHDVVVAELAWLAFAQLRSDVSVSVGPWEDPAVQRATALDLGVSVPSQLQLTVLPADPGDQLSHRLASALGL